MDPFFSVVFVFLFLVTVSAHLQEERGDLVSAYYRRLTGDDEATRLHCAQRWSGWEMATSRLIQDPKLLQRVEKDVWALQFARIEW